MNIKTLVLSAFAWCALSSATYADMMHDLPVAVSEFYVIPAYTRLAEAADAQDRAWQQGCDNKTRLVQEYHHVADAWARIQHLNYGPVTLLLRRDRLYHWPERRNAVSKALGKLLSSTDDSKLSQDSFPRSSVAGQGLPALERLLFDADMLQQDRACTTGQAIARNIRIIARDTARDWQSGDLSMMDKLKKGQPHDIWFDSNEEVANKFFTELLAGFQMISDQKILLPMGKDIHKANGKRSEAWRSGRSSLNIQHNIIGLIGMVKPFQTWVPDNRKPEFLNHIDNLVFAAGMLPDDLAAAVSTEKGRADIQEFKQKLRASRDGLADILVNDLGLVMGFNSLDGD